MKQGPPTDSTSFFDSIRRSFRRLCVRILARYFYIVPLPDTFKIISGAPAQFTVVTESTTLIIEALLYSFARRSGFSGSVHLGMQSARTREDGCIYWLGNFETEALAAIVAADPAQKFVTLNIFSGRGPFRHNPSYRLGFWDLVGVVIMGRFLIIFIGNPIQAASGVTSIHSALIRHLRLDFYKNLKLVRGTPFMPIETQAKVVLGGAEFTTELTQLAQKLKITEAELKRKAERAFYDIAANPRRPMYRIVAFIARVIIRRLFTSVQKIGMERLVSAVRESTVVIVPMHRSHLDYILLGHTLYDSNLNPPIVAAGVNLSFWPAGFIIRSVGGYFVKRNVRHDRLHALILKRYVSYLVKRGHLQEFFIEGGRSRSGKMRPPKVGLLNIFMDAHLKGYKRDITFIPVSITYENLIEDSAFGRENTGRSKEKETLFSLLKAGRIFRQKYGEVMLHFGEPISLRHHVETYSKNNRTENRSSVMELAHKITISIREQTNPSLTSLAHTALLMAPRYGLRREELIVSIKNLSRLILALHPLHNLMGSYTTSLDAFIAGKEAILSETMRGDSIQVKPCVDQDVFFIPGERRFVADFYRNATVHLLFEASLLAIMDLLELDLDSSSELTSFYNIFRHDFLLEEQSVFKSNFIRSIQLLKSSGIIGETGGRTQFIDRSRGIFIPALLQPSIQSIIWAVKNLSREVQSPTISTVPESGRGLRVVDYDELLKRMQDEFRTAVYVGMMHNTEASSLVTLTAALDTLSQLGMITVTEPVNKRKKIIINAVTFSELDILRRANGAILAWQSKSTPEE